MNYVFAYIPGALDGSVYMPGVEVTEVVEPAKPTPEIPPPCWDDRPILASACAAATKALCG